MHGEMGDATGILHTSIVNKEKVNSRNIEFRRRMIHAQIGDATSILHTL